MATSTSGTGVGATLIRNPGPLDARSWGKYFLCFLTTNFSSYVILKLRAFCNFNDGNYFTCHSQKLLERDDLVEGILLVFLCSFCIALNSILNVETCLKSF